MTEAEQGLEIFIPKDLSMDGLPKGYQYYDPIIQILQENISAERK